MEPKTSDSNTEPGGYIFFWLNDFYIPKFEASQSKTHQCWFSVYIIVVIIATITVIRSTAALPPAALEKCGKYHSHSPKVVLRGLLSFFALAWVVVGMLGIDLVA